MDIYPKIAQRKPEDQMAKVPAREGGPLLAPIVV